MHIMPKVRKCLQEFLKKSSHKVKQILFNLTEEQFILYYNYYYILQIYIDEKTNKNEKLNWNLNQ